MWDLFFINGQGWLQLEELMLAFVLSSLVGVEREIRQKSTGLRTHTLIGVSSALFMLISKYGFTNVLSPDQVVLDPSRIAAQIVSGIGFIGGGVIFMRRDAVRGLTTAASIWFTAALGMACGAGLLALALVTTLGHFIIMLGFPLVEARLPRIRVFSTEVHISYEDGRGLLRTILFNCTELCFSIDSVKQVDNWFSESGREEPLAQGEGASDSVEVTPLAKNTITMVMRLNGKQPISHLLAKLSEIDGIVEVGLVNNNSNFE
jgi:putative Mg2+ transporter-C (MgtC) family protein